MVIKSDQRGKVLELKKKHLNTILKILKVNNILSPDEIDGLLLKKMAMSNIIKSNRPATDTGKQTHIAITSKERILFPMVANIAYYEGSEEVKFYDMRLPVTLVRKNIETLDKEKKIKFDGDYLETETLCYMRKGAGDIQVQISKTKSDNETFIEFRKLMYEEDYLCVIKKKGEFKFFFLAFNKELKKEISEIFNTEENLIFIDDKSVTEISKESISEKKETKPFLSEENVLILALYLSKFSENALNYLDVKTWKEAYIRISERSKEYPSLNSINNLRDSFDPYFENGREGWHQRPLIPKYKNILDKYRDLEKNDFENIISLFWWKNGSISNKIFNRIIYGAPGTGKSHRLEEDSVIFPKITKNLILNEEIDPLNGWLVGAKYGNIDMLDDFLSKNYWENGYDDKYLDLVKNIKINDYIAIKSSFTRKLPLGKTISVLRVKAIGIVTKNYDDGKKVDVNWLNTNTKDYDNLSYRQTIHRANDKNSIIFNEITNSVKETLAVSINPVERVTFYDGYTYGQFVGTYKPVPLEESITYRYVPGPFMKQLLMAYKNPEDKFCLIIEEINRARADKVFGNIFQLLDRKNGISQYPIAVSEDQAAYLESELSENYSDLLSTILSEGLYIPGNFYIWATMNSADQGVYALDSAFKRRWHFEHVGLDENEEKFFDEETIPGIIFQSFKKNDTIYYDAVPWNDFRHEINKRLLKSKVFEDRLIAPFFIKPTDFIRDSEQEYLKDTIRELEEDIFLDKVLMYLFDDVLKHKNKNTLFKSEYESFSELKKGYRNTDFDGLPNIHSIFIEDLRKDLEVISNKKNLSWNKEDAVNNSETEKQDN
jgi:hypothetical protein